MQIEIQLSDDQARKLAYIQQHTQQDIFDLIDQAIEAQYQNLQPKKTPFEAFQELGLVGCIEGRLDSSENYKTIVHQYLQEKHDQSCL